ncbi:hypothetical protein SSX86_009466 [Deinandra increscens subsp. villosa]|uniref:Protein TIME FOR COFFEE n=1 Tax=Deinandra increscens subsp. villosa TaxID=3103831 RepID=A0AAP0DGY4_9ASTR
MDRNREGRRSAIMSAPSNGLPSSSSSRRRHRSSSLRDSPDEDGGVELQEPGRLRDRGVVKKDRGERERERDRDRDRDRERERSSRSKRRRENRMLIHHVTTGSNRDDGDDTSEESVNDEEEDDDDAGNGGGLRMLPPPPANPSTTAVGVTSNHHNHNPYPQQLQHRKTFPSSNNNKVFRGSAAAPPPAWKAADEMIGVSVPRKARSASTKRSHEWSSGGGVVGGGGGIEQINRQSSTSPVRLTAPLAPPSPSSSNVSARKKMVCVFVCVCVSVSVLPNKIYSISDFFLSYLLQKANGGSKPRPPKSSSKSSSSNPEELEIEIAEVLYGLMTQSQAPSKKEISSNDSATKFDSNKSTSIPPNSTSLSTVAPKRKRPRQVSENPFSVVSSSIKNEIDHHQSPKTDISSPYLENSSPASAVAGENGGVSSFGFTTLPGHPAPSSAPLPAAAAEEEGKCGVGVVLTKEEAEKESPVGGLNEGKSNTEAVIATAAATNLTPPCNPETESQKEEKFEIDLMAPPPQQRASQESDGDIDPTQVISAFLNFHLFLQSGLIHLFLSSSNLFTFFSLKPLQDPCKTKEDGKLRSGKEEPVILSEQKKLKSSTVQESGESSKQAMNVELRMDFEKLNKDGSNRSLHQALKHQPVSSKSEAHTEKTGQSSSLTMPISMAGWPPMGYVAPLQGVISMDGNTIPSAPVQQLFTHPRPKRCATHCYIARNIHYLQQFMKINPFWPAASGSAAPMFGAKHSTELHANIPPSMQDKGQPVGMFPGHTTGKDTKSSQTTAVSDPVHRKQQVLLQQAMPSVAPNNILHGPAFIFPFNQQQAVAASGSVRPGSSKLSGSTATGGFGGASGAANSAAVSSSTTSAAAPALSFNYPNMNANETQYLAIVQNHPYAFPMPAVGGPPNYRGSHPHPQAMPLFNGSFYSSQMMHPSQIQQPPQQAPPPTQPQQTHQNSSGSTSSSQKHMQAQQRQQGSAAAANGVGGGNGGGLHNSYPAAPKSRSQQPSQHMNPPAQARHLENEVTGGEDSPSTADSRNSRAAANAIYGHNFAMPVHSQNFALMNPQAAASANSNDKKQQSQQQQVLKRGGAESSSMPPQTFAMSFAPMNGTTGQNHAIFQSMPESFRQGYHPMMPSPAAAASGHHSEQKKDFRISEEATRAAGHDSSNVDDDRKGSGGLTAKSGQSIAFSRPDLATDASGSSAATISGTSVIDSSSSRNINLGSNNRSTRSPISNSAAAAAQSSHHMHAQFQQQQQQMLQLQKQQQQQQQQHVNARSKNPPSSSNGSGYSEHLSNAMALMYPNSVPPFPLQTSNSSVSPVQSPQWRNSVRGPTASQVSSSLASTTTSSLKNLHQTHQTHQSQQQQQPSRSHSQSHTQISFGAAAASQKLQSTASAQMQLPQQQQQQNQNQNQNPSTNSGNRCPSPPMLVGSPTTSLSSPQPPKNTFVGNQRSSPSILGNPHNSNSSKPQQQQQQQILHKQSLQQQQAQAKAYAQMMYTHPLMQVPQPQNQQHSVAGSMAASGYYLPRKQQQQQQPSQPQSSSTAMLSLCPPVTTSDPAKAIAAATSNMKGGVGLASQQGSINSAHSAQYGGSATSAAPSSMPAGFPQYVHNSPAAAAAAVQVKPAEQKQSAGNDSLRKWQPEK